MAFKFIRYSDNLDLTEFYKTAEQKGFVNNSSKKMLVDSLSNEDRYMVWLLTYKTKIIGSTAAHSFPEMGPDSYRIACMQQVGSHMLLVSSFLQLLWCCSFFVQICK